MSKVDVLFRRDESKIKLCPTWVIYSMPLVLIVMVASFIIMLLNFKEVVGQVCLVIFLFSFFWSIYSDKYYSMYENCRIRFKKDSVVYQYELNKSVMPSSDVTTTITITEISKIKVKRKTVVVKGTITRKAPLKKVVNIKKVEVPIDFAEREEIIEKLKERIK